MRATLLLSVLLLRAAAGGAAQATPPQSQPDAAAALLDALSASARRAKEQKQQKQQVKRDLAVELKTLKLTRQWIDLNYDAFAAGRSTFTMLKHHLGGKLALPHTAFAPGKRLGDLVDDEVHDVTARCDTGKRKMELCVWPTPTNVLWSLSVETIIEEASLDPNSIQAQRLRAHERESNAAALRISNVLHASSSPYDITDDNGNAIILRKWWSEGRWWLALVGCLAAAALALTSNPEWGDWLFGVSRGVRSSRGARIHAREENARRRKLLGKKKKHR